MVSKRMYDLLVKCAEEAREGKALLNHEFLLYHNVTSDECCDLVFMIADALDDYCAYVKPEEKNYEVVQK